MKLIIGIAVILWGISTQNTTIILSTLVIGGILIINVMVPLYKNEEKEKQLEKEKTEQEEEQRQEEEIRKRKEEIIEECKLIKSLPKIIIDCETTGLNENDEILQLSIINQDNEVLFNDYFKPIHKKKWEEATTINGITPEMVKDKLPIEKRLNEIQDIIDGYDYLVAYNVEFDVGMLERAGLMVKHIKAFDVMVEFAKIYKDYNEKRGDYNYQKLEKCCRYYGYKLENAHDSLEDTKATLYCFNKMIDNEIGKN